MGQEYSKLLRFLFSELGVDFKKGRDYIGHGAARYDYEEEILVANRLL